MSKCRVSLGVMGNCTTISVVVITISLVPPEQRIWPNMKRLTQQFLSLTENPHRHLVKIELLLLFLWAIDGKHMKWRSPVFMWTSSYWQSNCGSAVSSAITEMFNLRPFWWWKGISSLQLETLEVCLSCGWRQRNCQRLFWLCCKKTLTVIKIVSVSGKSVTSSKRQMWVCVGL